MRSIDADPRPNILCPACGLRSWNPNDVEQRYCGNCHHFHDELPEKQSGLAERRRAVDQSTEIG